MMDFPDYMEKVLKNCEKIGVSELAIHYEVEDFFETSIKFVFGFWMLERTPEICAQTLYKVLEDVHVTKMNERKIEIKES